MDDLIREKKEEFDFAYPGDMPRKKEDIIL